MKKIIILGLTGAGKTTLASKLGAMLDIPIFHLDQYFWKENWQHVSQAEFYAMQEKILAENPTWILDGGFPRSKTLDLRIAHADTIILFDLPIIVPLWRMTRRYPRLPGKERPDVGSGNNQQKPFGFKDVEYAIDYPIKELRAKLADVKHEKNVYLIKSNRDMQRVLEEARRSKLQ